MASLSLDNHGMTYPVYISNTLAPVKQPEKHEPNASNYGIDATYIPGG